MKLVYLDWASAAPVSRAAERAFKDAFDEQGNPGSPHAFGMRAKTILEDSRREIARLVGTKPDGVIFTSGATEANNLAIAGYVQALQEAGRKLEDIHLLYLPTAHASVVETMHWLAKHGVQVESLVITNGTVDLNALKKQIRPETALVSMDAVCGQTGTLWDTRDVRRVLDASHAEGRAVTGSRILLHVDASQAPFAESIEAIHLGADLMTLDAQKVGGIRGIGALVRKHSLIPLASIVHGGGQEQGLRPGTENPALANAFAVALSEVQQGRAEFIARSLRLRVELLSALTTSFPEITANVGKESVPHILNISLPTLDTDYSVMLLSEAGFMVSTKSACETDAVGSRAVLALTGDKDCALSTLRISWGATTRENSLRDFLRALIKTIQFQKSTQL